jgi:hypothetical protein
MIVMAAFPKVYLQAWRRGRTASTTKGKFSLITFAPGKTTAYISLETSHNCRPRKIPLLKGGVVL